MSNLLVMLSGTSDNLSKTDYIDDGLEDNEHDLAKSYLFLVFTRLALYSKNTC